MPGTVHLMIKAIPSPAPASKGGSPTTAGEAVSLAAPIAPKRKCCPPDCGKHFLTKRHKRWPVLLLLVLLFGCAPEQSKRPPNRILSLSAAATAVLTRLDLPPAAIDEYGLIAADAPPPPVIGKGAAISLEKITELEIDCVILWYYQEEAAARFRSAGLRVEVLPILRLNQYPDFLRQLGELTGQTAQAQALASTFRRELSQIAAEAGNAGIPVYFELYSPGKAAGEESYIGDLLRAAGGRSIFARTGLASAEKIIENAPEIIFYPEGFGNPAEIAARPGFASIPAVRHRRIYPVPRRLITEGIAPLEAVEYLQAQMR